MKNVLEVYLDIMKSNPKWTAKEESDFIKKWWKKDREYFVSEAMKHNLGIVFNAIRKVSFRQDIEDIFQKGVSALVKALREFKPEKGNKISTWVTKPVRWSVMQHQNPYNHQGLISDEIQALNRKYGRKMSVVSTDLSLKGKTDDDMDTFGNTISEKIIDSDYLRITNVKTREENEKEIDFKTCVLEMLKYAPKILNANELRVVRRILDGKNMTEISIEMNLCKMRISQITARAFEKIRNCKISGKLREMFK